MMHCWIRPLVIMISSAGTRPEPSAVGTSRWQIVPFSAPATLRRAWCCWAAAKKSTMRLIVSTQSIVCKRREDEVPGLGRAERRLDGLLVAHLADEDHVRVLAERRAQRDEEARGVEADFPLADCRQLVVVEDLDRVLDRDDVALASPVDVVDHGCECRRLPAAGRPVTSTRPAGLVGESPDRFGKVQLAEGPCV